MSDDLLNASDHSSLRASGTTPWQDKAKAAWGGHAPDWVMVLGAEADRLRSQTAAAKSIGYSGATVSLVLSNAYRGDLTRVEERVRAALMATSITCPEMGDMPLSVCLDWRVKARDFSATSSQRAVMYRACNRCPFNPSIGG